MIAEKREEKRTRVVFVGNQKGGVGKTTNTIQLAAALTQLGKTCLIIDLDSSCGATKSLRAPTSGWNGTYELITGAEDPENTVITNGDGGVKLPQGIDLIPASRALTELDTWLLRRENQWRTQQDLLIEPISELRGRHDFILLDTPPQNVMTVLPALKAADYAIIAAMPERLAVEAVDDALQDIVAAKKQGGAKIQLLGVVLCAIPCPKTRLARHLTKHVVENCVAGNGESLKFETEVSRAVILQEAQEAGETIFQYSPTSKSAQEYLALAKEVEERIAANEAAGTNAIDLPRRAVSTEEAAANA